MRLRQSSKPSALGRLILEAVARLEAERGAPYTYREWEHEIEEQTGQRIIYSHLRNMVAGRVVRSFRSGESIEEYRPRPEMLALALVPLRGFIDEDAAYLAAGHAPPRLQHDIEQLSQLRAEASNLTTAEAIGGEVAALELELRDLLGRAQLTLHRITSIRRAPPPPTEVVRTPSEQ